MGKNHEQYPIRDGLSFGSHDAGGMSHEDVKNKLKNLNPEKVGSASTAYKDAAEALAEMTDELRNNFSKKIIKHWKGEAAQKALDQLGQVYTTAGKLSDDSHRNATLYAWYKHDVLDWYKTQGETMTDGFIHTGGDDDNARELMNRFIWRMKQAFEGHPLRIEKDLPSGYGGGDEDPPPYGGGGGPYGGGGGGKFSGAGSGFGTSDGASPFSPVASTGASPWDPAGNGPFNPGGSGPFDPGGDGPHLPGGGGVPGGGGSLSGGPSSDLSGFPGGGGGGMPGGGLPGGGGGGFGADPGGFGGAGAGSGPGAGGLGGGMGGAAGRGAAGMRGGMPMGGMPMGAPGQGGKGEERERQTWLSEDEDVWGGDDDTAPPVIG